ncbi:MAG: FAD-dependent oxidoreductase [Rhabdochlamydiaceae bacterium]|nr:FAD-dependent oxidoreductase [Rhabdochlamydiaceae bacterium]
MSKPFDVIVVGSGYTGLSAALKLQSEGSHVLVLEANNRVGGRALDVLVAGNFRLELGGQYIAPVQERVTRMISHLGLETYQAWGKGNNFMLYKEQIALHQETPAECIGKLLGDVSIQKEIEKTLSLLDAMQKDVPADKPWQYLDAHLWDSMTFQSWIDGHVTSAAAKEFFRFMTNQGFSTEPEQVSLLQMLWFFKTSHGLPPWAIGGKQANRVKGGTGLVAIKMAEKLKEPVRYDERVIKISQSAENITVFTEKNIFSAKSAIVAIPPQMIPAIHYEPQIPSDIHRAFSSLQTGNAMKVQAVFKTPFWREKNLSGNGISFNRSPTFTYDNSGEAGTPGVLLGFLTGSQATEMNKWSLEKRKQSILSTWAQVFGSEIMDPIEYIEHNWLEEPNIRGGHGCHFPPGVWKELGAALGQKKMPHFQRIIWAASDLAKDWNGYLEGAIHAGEQAAIESLSYNIRKSQTKN